MKRARELSREQLVKALNRVQEILFVDVGPSDLDDGSEDAIKAGVKPVADYWNPDKEWNGADTLDGIRGVLVDYQLVPVEVEKYVCGDEKCQCNK